MAAPKSKVEKALEFVQVEILSPVEHDGERLLVGAVHEIEKLAAEALIACGAAKLAAKAAPAEAAK